MRGWVIRIGIIAVIAVGAFLFRDRLSGNAGDLKVGECFDVPTAAANIKDVQHHPCTESHTGEVFAIVTHPAAKGTPALSEDELFSFLGTSCGPAFTSYVGPTAASAGTLDFGAFYPLDKDWVDGDRNVTCYVYRIDEAAMTTSLKTTP